MKQRDDETDKAEIFKTSEVNKSVNYDKYNEAGMII